MQASEPYMQLMIQKWREEIKEMLERRQEKSLYVLIRHSGRNSGGWRVVASKTTMQEATRAYSLLSSNLRQGTVVLWDVMDEEPVHFMSAPRLKTRW